MAPLALPSTPARLLGRWVCREGGGTCGQAWCGWVLPLRTPAHRHLPTRSQPARPPARPPCPSPLTLPLQPMPTPVRERFDLVTDLAAALMHGGEWTVHTLTREQLAQRGRGEGGTR